MNTTLWIIQGILGALFLMAGSMKATQSIEKLVKSGINFAERVPLPVVRFIGISEILGGVGLILPFALKIQPVLTPISASALVLIMLLAAIHHGKHKEIKNILINLILLVLAAFVAYGRFGEFLN